METMTTRGGLKLRVRWALSASIAVALLAASCAPAAQPAPSAPAPAAPQSTVAPPAPPAAPTATPRPAVGAPTPTPVPTAIPTATTGIQRGGTLKALVWATPEKWEPYLVRSMTAIAPMSLGYGTIVRENPNKPGELIGDLAEGWTITKDGTVYTFKMRKGVKWHDGAPFTAKDAAFGLTLLQDKSPSMSTQLKGSVKSIEAPDDSTVVMTLKQIDPSILSALAGGRAFIAPRQIVEAKKDFRTNVVGTGPFKFKSYRTDVSMEWVRNTDYYMPGKPYLDGVTYYIVPDRASGKAAMKTGQADIAAPVYMNLTDQDDLNKTPGTRAFRYLNQNYEFFSLNAQVAPFNNVNVRKALYMAVDRNVFNQLVLAGSGQAVGAIPPDLGGYTVDELSKYPGYRKDKAQDLDEAKKLLAQEGQSNLSFSVIYRPGPGYKDSAIFVQDQMSKIGVKVELKTMDDATFLDAAFNRKFQSQVMRQVPFPKDPSVILGSYFSTGDPSENTTATSDPKLDKLINEQAALALDFAARSKKLKEIQDYLINNGYNNVLAWGSYQGALRTSVQGYQPLTSIYNNLQHDTIWIAK